MTDQWSDEQPDDPQYADQRDFYKVEKWSRDGMRIKQMLYADSSLGKVQAVFSAKVKHRARDDRAAHARLPRSGARTRSGPLVVARDAGARRQALSVPRVRNLRPVLNTSTA